MWTTNQRSDHFIPM